MTYVADAAEATGLEILVKIETRNVTPSYPLDGGQPLVLKVVCYHSRSIAVGGGSCKAAVSLSQQTNGTIVVTVLFLCRVL